MRAKHVARRFGFSPSRGTVVLAIIIAVLAAGAFWIGPFRPRPPELKLLALSGDGNFREYAGIPSAWADTLPAASEATARFPLILAVHNAGSRVARPTKISLSLPAKFRITDARGQPLQSFATMGNPLVRYELPIQAAGFEPGKLPTMIGGADTLWLEPIIPSIYCTALADSVPEFVSAPPQNPELNSRVRVFYSFAGGSRRRQTGLLTIQVDPNLVKRDPAPSPPIFATQVIKPEAPRPAMSELTYVGSRITWCGDPGQPVEIHDALWETAEGGRFFVLYHGGAPRKYLFDVNRDSIIELEMWDQDGDGKFESRRAARMAIPSFLMPFPKPAGDTTAAAIDTTALPLDTVPATPEWMQLFYDTAAGPLRFGRRAPPARADSAAAPPQVQVPDTVKQDPQFRALFENTDAGPFRFYRAQRGETIPPPKPKPPQPRVQRGPPLLGVPVDSIRR